MVNEYGSDALRLGLIASRSAGQNQAFGVDRVVTGRNFCNKLWNIARYIESTLPDDFETKKRTLVTPADHWIVRQLNTAAKTISEQIENYRFAEARETVYRVIWNDVADWYIEASKKSQNEQLLAWVLDTVLKLAHPFAPFVTEAIWQTLSWHDDLLITSHWPKKAKLDEEIADEFDQIQSLVVEARYVLSELPAGKKYTLVYHKDKLIKSNETTIAWLARLKAVEHTTTPKGLRLAVADREAWLELDEDTLYEHQTRLESRLVDTREHEKMLKTRLDNPRYVDQAPKHLVDETRAQLQEKQALIERLEREINVLK